MLCVLGIKLNFSYLELIFFPQNIRIFSLILSTFLKVAPTMYILFERADICAYYEYKIWHRIIKMECVFGAKRKFSIFEISVFLQKSLIFL